MRKTLIVIVCLLCASLSHAANYYVRSGGSSAACTAWTNACPQLTTAVGVASRGDTIYVGGGTYNGGTFNTAASGTSVITIKRATIDEHGTDTGWSDSYANGTALFGSLTFSSQYWVFDGSFRESSTTGHGFKVVGPAPETGIRVSAHNVTIRYTEITSPNVPIIDGCVAAETCVQRGVWSGGPSSSAINNLTVESSYIHDVCVPVMYAYGGANFIFRYNHVARNDSTPATHSEAFSFSYGTISNLLIHSNIFESIEGTATIAMMNQVTVNGALIYNNVTYYPVGSIQTGTGNGWLTCTNSGTTCSDLQIYNNTFVNIKGIRSTVNLGSGGAGYRWTIKNNLWYCNTACANVSNSSSDQFTYDKNWYGGVAYNANEAGAINGGATSPFTNVAGLDFSLVVGTSAIGAGADLSGVFTTDVTGATRTTPWDIGAYKYGSSGGLPDPDPDPEPTGSILPWVITGG